MKTITVSSRARTLNALLKQALQENLILRTADGHEFLLAEIADFDREIELTRQNEELMQLLAPAERLHFSKKRCKRYQVFLF